MAEDTDTQEHRQADQSAPASPPTPRELALARGLLAILRTHESAGDPAAWTVDAAEWGDGRTTFEVHDHEPGYGGRPRRALVCQFRPDDHDGTEADALGCVEAAQRGLREARSVISEAMAWARECESEQRAQRAEDWAAIGVDAREREAARP
jgi:hypothetical protein